MSKNEVCINCQREVPKGKGFRAIMKIISKRYPLNRATIHITLCEECGWKTFKDFKEGVNDENA